ncbi:MAG: isoaspartyl peptidase/L-asparaginase family protein [Candidatus Neomarinimicrobiota bacterium]
MKRRNFIKVGAAGLASPILLAGNKNMKINKNNPIVISTWSHGIPANEVSMKILKKSGSALDAVEAGVQVTEADAENQSVGLGGRPDREGNVTLDACIMDSDGNAGAVAFLQHIKHPISVARKVMEKTDHVMLAGKGALKFALENGFKKENLLTEKSKKGWLEWKKNNNIKDSWGPNDDHDTITSLAQDNEGNLSGACTTSGLAYKLHGRVGDSPIIGAGMYVDNEVGVAGATGVGELVIKTCGSFLVVELMRHGYSAMEACKEAVDRIIKQEGGKTKLQVGYIALGKDGSIGYASIQKGFQYALYKGNTNKLHDVKSVL